VATLAETAAARLAPLAASLSPAFCFALHHTNKMSIVIQLTGWTLGRIVQGVCATQVRVHVQCCGQWYFRQSLSLCTTLSHQDMVR